MKVFLLLFLRKKKGLLPCRGRLAGRSICTTPSRRGSTGAPGSDPPARQSQSDITPLRASGGAAGEALAAGPVYGRDGPWGERSIDPLLGRKGADPARADRARQQPARWLPGRRCDRKNGKPGARVQGTMTFD
jgi:hypothetical protein